MIRILNGWRVAFVSIRSILPNQLSDETIGALMIVPIAILFSAVATAIHLAIVFS